MDSSLVWLITTHLSIVRDYVLSISKTCDFENLRHADFFDEPRYADLFDEIKINDKRGLLPDVIAMRAATAASLADDIRDVFVVPRPANFHESQNRFKKYQLVEVFISFLHRLLCHKTEPGVDGINDLGKELRFLHPILADPSLMLCDYDEHEQVRNLLEEFEAVANEAGSLVHSYLFSVDPLKFEEMDEGLNVFSSHIDLLKANIMRCFNFLSSMIITTPTPKTSVVNSFLVVDSLIYDLEDLLNREDNLIACGVKDQVKTLHQGLIFLRSSVKDIGLKQPSEIKEIKELVMRIGDMARGAEYIIISFLAGDTPHSYLINRLTDINHKIQLIGIDLIEITNKYKIGDLKLVAKSFGALLPLQAKRNWEVDDVIVGFEDKAIHIVDQLVGGTGRRLQVISIFGMAGLGKTTLAKKLYNHSSVNYWFDKSSWCVISQTYQRRSTMANILIQIASELDKDGILDMEEENLVEHIYKSLKGRRYLIVMDDIWDFVVWDDLRRCFPDDRNGSKILFTTRNKDVAPPPPTGIIYPLPSFTTDECWELLEKKAFGDKPCPLELLGIGRKIAANCGGLPLAVVVIAGILSTMNKEKSAWEEVEGKLASFIFHGDHTVMQILELSYRHLPEYLKPCFLYFGAFSEDKEIPVGNLTKLWIAEGFIHKEVGRSTENVAEEYLMELIDKSLVMVTKRRLLNGGAKTCVVHDLLRDFCLRKSEEENFLKFVDDDIYSIYEKGHRLLVPEVYVPWSHRCYVRSFLSFSMNNSPIIYFRNSVSPRVLYRVDFTPFPGIEYLASLRYLVVKHLQAPIDNLVNLEYLRVEGMNTTYLSPAIMKMKKLRYIHMEFGAMYDRDCNSSQTNNLEYLSRIQIGSLKDEEMLKCSPHLRKLQLVTRQPIDLNFFTQLDSLRIGPCRLEIEKIRLPSSIRKLALYESRLPWEKMSMIGRLENLEVLKLGHYAFKGKRWDTRDGEFKKLRCLKMVRIRFTEWNVASRDHFPNLRQLILIHCRYLQEIPSEIGEIETLEMIQVQGKCSKSLVESAMRIQQEQQDMGNELRISISEK